MSEPVNFVRTMLNDIEQLLDVTAIKLFAYTDRFGKKEVTGLHSLHFSGNSSSAATTYYLLHKGERIAEFTLVQLPGCCGVCVFTGSWTHPGFRNRGLSSRFNLFAKQAAAHHGYTVLLCTDVVSNKAQKKVLERNAWMDLFRFRNARTSNLVDISVTPLSPVLYDLSAKKENFWERLFQFATDL